jgi:uncharacterized spore protein YtfJ
MSEKQPDNQSEIERIGQMVGQARDAMTVKRVYGDPIERDGTTVIPAASVAGGGGGGGGVDAEGQTGGGTGFGLRARPVGAFVIRDGDVRWEPVEDPLGKLIVIAAAVTTSLFIVRSMVRKRRRR